jgi:maltose O-acetyltransferase
MKYSILRSILFKTIPEKGLLEEGAKLPYETRKWLGCYHPSVKIRHFFLETIGFEIGKDAFINLGLMLAERGEEPGKVIVKVGARVAISPGVTLITCSSPNNSRLAKDKYVKEHLIKEAPIIIEDDAWLGAGAIVFPGVTIGKESIVGAGAVVVKDVPERTIVAGIPAKVIRSF